VQYQAEPHDETMPTRCVLWNNIEFRNYVEGHEFYGPLHRGMGSAMRPRMLLDEPTPKYWIESWADPELRTLAAVCVAEIRMAWNKPPASDDDDDEEQEPAEDASHSMQNSRHAEDGVVRPRLAINMRVEVAEPATTQQEVSQPDAVHVQGLAGQSGDDAMERNAAKRLCTRI
jgi:hypothetical protein